MRGQLTIPASSVSWCWWLAARQSLRESGAGRQRRGAKASRCASNAPQIDRLVQDALSQPADGLHHEVALLCGAFVFAGVRANHANKSKFSPKQFG